MSNSSSGNTSNNLYNICSLEHCYTNLFALTDITGIQWLKLRAKKSSKSMNKSSSGRLNGGGGGGNKRKTDDDDEDDEDDDEDDDDDDDDEEEEDENEEQANSGDKAAPRMKSQFLATSALDDPILVTHARCLSEGILSAWKRRIGPKQYPIKELWIFWFENEQPANLKSVISRGLVVSQSDSNSSVSYSHSMSHQQHGSGAGENLLDQAMSSHNGLPYETRSMLFKALHNLIERSLLDKGYARLGKWFVMPYNLQAVNYSIYGGWIFNSMAAAAAASVAGFNGGSDVGIAPQASASATTTATLASQQPLTPLSTQQSPATPQSVNPKGSTASKQPSSTNLSQVGSTSGGAGGAGTSGGASASLSSKLNLLVDESNHVSYSFEFFLHGSSRVCTSVDIGMHKPVRVVNQLDLIKMRACLKKHFLYASQRSRRRHRPRKKPLVKKNNLKNRSASQSSLNPLKNNSSQKSLQESKSGAQNSNKPQPKQQRRNRRLGKRFMGLKVILAPYGISGRLLGYLSNDSVESRVTCDEWRQFYPLRLLPNMPNVFCVGVDHNRVKLFYPNCFVYVVMDREGDRSDDDDDDGSLIEDVESRTRVDVEEDVEDEEESESVDESEEAAASDDDWLSDELLWDDRELEEFDDDDEDEDDVDDETSSEEEDDEDEDGDENESDGEENKTKASHHHHHHHHHRHHHRRHSHRHSHFSDHDGADIDTADDTADMLLDDDEASAKIKAKNRAEMDSLDLTIDSVARNFGSNAAAAAAGGGNNNNTSSQTLEPSPNNTTTATLTPTAAAAASGAGTAGGVNNRSILSISQNSPLSVNAISSPTSSSMLLSPSLLNSPGKQGLKRQKSSNNTLANRSLSNIDPTTPNPAQPPQQTKKRKKTLDSSSSDVSLNNSSSLLTTAKTGKTQPTAQPNTSQQQAVSSQLDTSVNKSGAKQVRLNINSVRARKRSIQQRQRRRLRLIQRKERTLMKQAQFFSVQRLIDNPYETTASANKQKISSKSNACCKYNYNVYKDLHNQLRLKHKKYDLNSENLPLAFDLLDRASLQTCSNSLCYHTLSNRTCVQCKMSKSCTNSRCHCRTLQNQLSLSAKCEPKSVDLQQQKKLSLSSNAASNPTLASLLKQSNNVGDTILFQSTSAAAAAANSYNVLSTRFDEPFHRRSCYFRHTKQSASYRSKWKDLNLGIKKTIQFKNTTTTTALNNKDQQQMVVKSKTVRIRNDQIVNTDDDEDDHNNDDAVDDLLLDLGEDGEGLEEDNDEYEDMDSEMDAENDEDEDAHLRWMDDADYSESGGIKTEKEHHPSYLASSNGGLNATDDDLDAVFAPPAPPNREEPELSDDEDEDDDDETLDTKMLNYQHFERDEAEVVFESDVDVAVKHNNSVATVASSSLAAKKNNSLSTSDSDLNSSSSSASSSESASSSSSSSSSRSSSSGSSSSSSSSRTTSDDDGNSSDDGNRRSAAARKSTQNREYLSNLTNKSSSGETGSKGGINPASLAASISSKLLKSPSSLNKLLLPKAPTTNSDDLTSLYPPNDDLETEETCTTLANEQGGAFEALYAYENIYGTAPPSTTSAANLELMDESSMQGAQQQSQSAANMIKSSQMTPPKSVESVSGGQYQAVPHVSGGAAATASAQSTAATTTTTTTTTTTSTTHNIPPISYDDLNNIFEEESSTDEQQQQQQPVQSQQFNSWNDQHQQSTLNAQQSNQQTSSQQQPNQQQNQPVQAQLVNTTIQTSLSVVMTPPSHENIIVKSCQNMDDVHEVNNHSSSTTTHFEGPVEGTKSIAFTDLNSILTSSSRKCLLTDLLTEQPNALFRPSSATSRLTTTQQTNCMNKYKPVRLVCANPVATTTSSSLASSNLVGASLIARHKLKWRKNRISIKKKKRLEREKARKLKQQQLKANQKNSNIISLKRRLSKSPLRESKLSQRKPSIGQLSQQPQPQKQLATTSRAIVATNRQLSNTQTDFVKLKPMEAFYAQLDQRSLRRSRVDAASLARASFVNSACLSMALSDTLLNLYRDINFDSCTLCVCTHHTIKGVDYPVYICHDIFGALDDDDLNVYNSSSGCISQQQSQQMANDGQDPNTSLQGYNRCTCGFSSIRNRGIMARLAHTVRLNDLVEFLNRIRIKPSDKDRLVPYFNLISTLNQLTKKQVKSKQLIVLDTSSSSGLFAEDYVDILMLTQPHSLITQILSNSNKKQQQQLVLNSQIVTRTFLNSILFRENYLWKRAFVLNKPSTVTAPTTSNTNKHVENANQTPPELSVLDLFDTKYSNPILSIQDAHDIYYSSHVTNQTGVDDLAALLNRYKSKKKYRRFKKRLTPFTLEQFDENSVCANTLRKLTVSNKNDAASSQFLLHEWLYEKREVKSNLELTRSLKLIQPLLYDTVQKKGITSNMWESFQGPLTWQHFCKLAFKDASNKQTSLQSVSGPGGSSASSSLHTSQSHQNASNMQTQNCYEPEPIPALLVSSAEKEWLTISPYAVKFWDKLNLEPYSKVKNIAYLVLMPDFMATTNDAPSEGQQPPADMDECEVVRDYFKELSSTYELCRLGVHRPALRIAPDHGLIRVPLAFSKKAATSNAPNPTAASSSKTQKVKVDPWFTQIQANKQTRQLGRHLKAYAKAYRSLAQKITTGHASTMSTTVESTFFNQATKATGSSSSSKSTSGTNAFQSTVSATISSINLDKSIFDEYKPSKHESGGPQSSTPSLSNLLSQPIGNDLGGLLGDSAASTSDAAAAHDSAATSATSQHHGDGKSGEDASLAQHYQQCAQQQQTLNQWASASSSFTPASQIAQLTAHMTSPPALFVYVIDPFDYYLYNSRIRREFAASAASRKSTDDGKTHSQNNDDSDLDDDYVDEEWESSELSGTKISESDMKRLRTLGLMKAYMEFHNNLPDLFKYSSHFQIVPLSLCLDLQAHSTSMYMQSSNHANANTSVAKSSSSLVSRRCVPASGCPSSYSSLYAAGFGTSWSDLDGDFKMSALKNQAFSVFALSKRHIMSPAFNYYLNAHQQQNNPLRPKTLTGFGPAANEEKFLRESFYNSLIIGPNGSKSTPRHMQFYSPAYILAPSTITTSAVSLAASHLFFKQADFAAASATTPTPTSKSSGAHQLSSLSASGGVGECLSLLPHFIQLTLSNSHYGFLNGQNNYNYNLNELVHTQQQLLNGLPGVSSLSLLSNGPSGSGSGSGSGSSGSSGGSSQPQSNIANGPHMHTASSQPYQQQCNVLYVGYCLSEDERYVLASCTDENGELIESTSISVDVPERFRRRDYHSRRIGLRKLWEFIVALMAETCKPWRLVIGRLGRMGHSELRAWACLLSKRNLQRYCGKLREQCDACNVLGQLEMPCILSACLISLESCAHISVYPEASSREDKALAAGLSGQQQQLANHATQAHGVSCTHILTFPASAATATESSYSSMKDDGDMSSKSGAIPLDDNDFFKFFSSKFDDELGGEMNELIPDATQIQADSKGGFLNESGLGGMGMGIGIGGGEDAAAARERQENMLLNQEETAHLDQQPLAVGYYVSTARCGPLPPWLRAEVPTDTNYHTFKAMLHIHNSRALEEDDFIMKAENSHKLDSPVTYEVLRYILERYNALSWLNIDPLVQDRKSCLPIHHSILLQMYYAFKNFI